MPKCSTCGGADTQVPTLISGGDGINVYGTGEPDAPYVIEADRSESVLALEVRDSTTINFQLTGSGSLDDPYTLTGDTGSATSLTDLADYQAAALPTAGQVVTWTGSSTGGHWTAASLPAGTAPTTSAAALTSGILPNARLSGVMVDALAGGIFTGDANSLLTPGMYFTGSGWTNGPAVFGNGVLSVAAAGTGVSQMWVSAGGETGGLFYYRAKAQGAAGFTTWRRVATSDDLATLLQQVNSTGGSIGSVGAQVTTLQGQVNALNASAGAWNTAATQASQALQIATALNQSAAAWNTAAQRATDLSNTATPTFQLVSGDWIVVRANFYRSGRVLTMDLGLQRNGTAFPTGDFPNVTLGNITGGFGTQGKVPLGGEPFGTEGYVSSTAIVLTGAAGGIPNGTVITLGGTWVMS